MVAMLVRCSSSTSVRWLNVAVPAEAILTSEPLRLGKIKELIEIRIPDLGRVAAIRQEGGRWVVVMDKGMTIRER
ncbi:MAG TPA: hypothetical protein VNO18_13265 [Xanthobacteraceae bacterium]|nr:hypothetical protein [Xanthobacteraceae bacterium]